MNKQEKNNLLSLLEIYKLGFKDELNGTFNSEKYKDKQESLIYLFGQTDAILVNDCPSVDYRNDEQIMHEIRNIIKNPKFN